MKNVCVDAIDNFIKTFAYFSAVVYNIVYNEIHFQGCNCLACKYKI